MVSTHSPHSNGLYEEYHENQVKVSLQSSTWISLDVLVVEVFHLFFCCTDLKPQLEDAQQRLEDAKTKKDQVMRDLETIQNNLNITTSNTHSTHTHIHTEIMLHWIITSSYSITFT